MQRKVPSYRPLSQLRLGLSAHVQFLGGGLFWHSVHHLHFMTLQEEENLIIFGLGTMLFFDNSMHMSHLHLILGRPARGTCRAQQWVSADQMAVAVGMRSLAAVEQVIMSQSDFSAEKNFCTLVPFQLGTRFQSHTSTLQHHESLHLHFITFREAVKKRMANSHKCVAVCLLRSAAVYCPQITAFDLMFPLKPKNPV